MFPDEIVTLDVHLNRSRKFRSVFQPHLWGLQQCGTSTVLDSAGDASVWDLHAWLNERVRDEAVHASLQ